MFESMVGADLPARTRLKTTRRELLGAAAVTLLGAGVGCGGTLRTKPNEAFLRLPTKEPNRVALGLYRRATPAQICQQAIAQITDLSWLEKGDSVFLKLACNSDEPHPAVTYPAAVVAMVELLRARGAGIIYVGDQAGVEHVRLTRKGRVSATEQVMERNGLLAAVKSAKATLHCFDDQGWDGYYPPALDFANHWEQPPQLAKILQRVDHVVYLPRLGSHALAGYTCGIKIAVGWLRDDSRRLLHQRGDSFFEKIAEINRLPPLRNKLRLTLTLGSHALLNIGPDIGSAYSFDGHLLIASTSLSAHDAVAAALLPWLDRNDQSIFDLYRPYPDDVDHWNRGFVKDMWGPRAMKDYRAIEAYALGHHLALDPCVSHLAVLEGKRPAHTAVQLLGDQALPGGMGKSMHEHLARYSGRPFVLR